MPRAGLNEERVVAQAEQLVDEIGVQQLSLAALAARLGVRQPSLYKHIHSIGGVQRSIAVRAKIELADALRRRVVGRSGPDALRALCAEYRAWALAHPGRYAATVRAPSAEDDDDLAASAAAVEVVTQVLAAYRLSDVGAIDATRTIRAALHGFVMLEADHGFGLPQDVSTSFDHLVDSLMVALENECFETADAP